MKPNPQQTESPGFTEKSPIQVTGRINSVVLEIGESGNGKSSIGRVSDNIAVGIATNEVHFHLGVGNGKGG